MQYPVERSKNAAAEVTERPNVVAWVFRWSFIFSCVVDKLDINANAQTTVDLEQDDNLADKLHISCFTLVLK